jgi:hypothetical protein
MLRRHLRIESLPGVMFWYLLPHSFLFPLYLRNFRTPKVLIYLIFLLLRPLYCLLFCCCLLTHHASSLCFRSPTIDRTCTRPSLQWIPTLRDWQFPVSYKSTFTEFLCASERGSVWQILAGTHEPSRQSCLQHGSGL